MANKRQRKKRWANEEMKSWAAMSGQTLDSVRRQYKAGRKKTARQKRRNPPARNSVKLTNFTGKVARLASGQVQVHGVQMKKPNPSRRKRK